MIERILAADDESEESEKALKTAIDPSKRPGAATIRISHQQSNDRPDRSDSCCRAAGTAEWNECALESAFRTSTSFCAMKKNPGMT